uniref:Reverse transcriptase domain-containing protein n=1 Tax=Trichobilharzia regenti TaxID=157069 RepID=A0AA85K9Y8_TRIRE|nr:unnamed protein product [Trichobilharzia regenti]
MHAPTRYHPEHDPSTLDLVLTHQKEDVGNIRCLPPLGSSDHIVIAFTFRIHSLMHRPKSARPNIWKADIQGIRNAATVVDWSVDTSQTVEEAWVGFRNTLDRVTSPFIPWYTPRKPSHEPPWITSEIRRLLRRRKNLWDQFVMTGRENFQKDYRKTRNLCKYAINKSRIEYERRLVLDCVHYPKRFYSYIKRRTKTSSGIPSLITISGEAAESDEGKAENLSEYFCDVFSSDSTTQGYGEVTAIATQMPSIVVEHTKVLKLLSKLKPGKSPGPDGLHPKLLLSLADIIYIPLTEIFQMSLTQAKLPRDWKDAIISPIFKDGDRQLVSNYRPVSLTCIIAKVLETIIRDQLLAYVETHGLLAVEQHGFRPGRSCLTNLLLAREDWVEARDRDHLLDVVFIDLSKAFDKVSHLGLLSKLKGFGLDQCLCEWFRDYLMDRRQKVRVNGVLSGWKAVSSGVPQGTVLGPLLFLLYVNELPGILSSSSLLFADDIKVWKTVNNNEDRLALQNDLDKLAEWSSLWSLEMNARKSAVMHLGQKSYTSYSLGDAELPDVKEQKDLGIIVSNDLKTTANCNAAAAKAFRMLWAIRRAFKRLDEGMFQILYATYVRPHLEYCIQATSPCFKKEAHILERVQRVGTKLVSGISHLPYDKRMEHLNLFPLSYRRKRGDLILAYRILKGDLGTDLSNLFSPSRIHLRGHRKKVLKPRTIKIRAEFRFSHRVVNDWNSLPDSVVSAPSVNAFKEKLDLCRDILCKD